MRKRGILTVIALVVAVIAQSGASFGQFGGLLDRAQKEAKKATDKKAKKENPQPASATQPQPSSASQPQTTLVTQPQQTSVAQPPVNPEPVAPPASPTVTSAPAPRELALEENLKALDELAAKQKVELQKQEQSEVDASLKLQGSTSVPDSLSGYKTLKWGKFELEKLMVVPVLKPSDEVRLAEFKGEAKYTNLNQPSVSTKGASANKLSTDRHRIMTGVSGGMVGGGADGVWNSQQVPEVGVADGRTSAAALGGV